jgi:hypothetical protein
MRLCRKKAAMRPEMPRLFINFLSIQLLRLSRAEESMIYPLPLWGRARVGAFRSSAATPE